MTIKLSPGNTILSDKGRQEWDRIFSGEKDKETNYADCGEMFIFESEEKPLYYNCSRKRRGG